MVSWGLFIRYGAKEERGILVCSDFIPQDHDWLLPGSVCLLTLRIISEIQYIIIIIIFSLPWRSWLYLFHCNYHQWYKNWTTNNPVTQWQMPSYPQWVDAGELGADSEMRGEAEPRGKSPPDILRFLLLVELLSSSLAHPLQNHWDYDIMELKYQWFTSSLWQ